MGDGRSATVPNNNSSGPTRGRSRAVINHGGGLGNSVPNQDRRAEAPSHTLRGSHPVDPRLRNQSVPQGKRLAPEGQIEETDRDEAIGAPPPSRRGRSRATLPHDHTDQDVRPPPHMSERYPSQVTRGRQREELDSSGLAHQQGQRGDRRGPQVGAPIGLRAGQPPVHGSAIPPKMAHDANPSQRSKSVGPATALEDAIVNLYVSAVSKENAVLVSCFVFEGYD